MKILIFFLASAAQAYTSLTVPAGSSVTLNIPEVPAFAMKDFRIEGRIHNLAPIASGSINILQTPQIRIFILFSTGTCTISGTCTCGLGADASADDGSGVDAVIIPTQCFCSQSTTPGDGQELAICVNVTGSPDFQFRAQRFASGSTVQSAWPGGQTLEVMDLATGVMLAPTAGGWIGRWAGGLRPTGTTANNGSSSPRQFLGGSGSPAFSIAWFKWSSQMKMFGTTELLPYVPASRIDAIGSSASTVLQQPVDPLAKEDDPADLLDLRFESIDGNCFKDYSTGNYGVTANNPSNLTCSTQSPVESPVCALPQTTYRTGSPQQLINNSFSPDIGKTLTYQWSLISQTAGTPTIVINSGNVRNASVTASQLGSGTFQLIMSDGTNQTTCSVKEGFVHADAQGRIIYPNPLIERFMGPTLMWKYRSTPEVNWLQNDNRFLAFATFQRWRALIQTPNPFGYFGSRTQFEGNIPLSGTIDIEKAHPETGPSIIRGHNTHFQTDFCGGPGNTTPIGFGTVPVALIIWYPRNNPITDSYPGVPPLPGFSIGTGRRPVYLKECTSDTEMLLAVSNQAADGGYQIGGQNARFNNDGSLTPYFGGLPLTGLNYSKISPSVWGNIFLSGSVANFYDNVLAYYTLWERSGIDDWLTIARDMADNYAQVFLDDGLNYGPAIGSVIGGYQTQWNLRTSPLGVTMRALDGRPDLFHALWLWATYHRRASTVSQGGQMPWTLIGASIAYGPRGDGNNRDNGYQLMVMALTAAYSNRITPTPASPNGEVAQARDWVSDTLVRGYDNAYRLEGNNHKFWPNAFWLNGDVGPNQARTLSWEAQTSACMTHGSVQVTCVTSADTCHGQQGAGTPGRCIWWDGVSTMRPATNLATTLFHPNSGWWFYHTNSSPPGLPISLPSGTPIPLWPPWRWQDGDPAVYFPSYVSSTEIALDRPYEGPSGLAGWGVGNSTAATMKVPGYIVQPFLNGVLGTAFEVASDGLKCGFNTVTNLSCDDVKAATYKSYVAELAYHLRDYGFWDDGKGVYYFASTAACQPPSTLKVDCLSKDPPATPTAPEPARIISVEAMNIVTRAYLDNHDPSLKALGDEIQANAWGQIGWPGPVTGDWRILDSYMPAGYFILNNPGTKWLGMPWGVGISSAWPAARMSAPAPTVEEVSYWPFGYPQSSKAERYPNMTATAGCSSCTAYGFEFTTTSTTPVTGFAIRQSGSAQNGRWGAFAIYNGTTGALITSCNSAFSLGAAATRLTCPATPSTSLPAGTYELVFVANSNTATISAVNSGVNLGSTIDSASVYSIAGLANLSAAPTVVWQQSMNLSSRVNTAAEPPHVLLLP